MLYIVVDDLRPELPVYGQNNIVTPHLTALAQRGVTYDRAYCQQAVNDRKKERKKERKKNQERQW